MLLLLNAMDDSKNPRCQPRYCIYRQQLREDAAWYGSVPGSAHEQAFDVVAIRNKSVQEAALTALASTADNAQESFVKCPRHRAPYQVDLVAATARVPHVARQGGGVHFARGMAVGRARFAADAREVMDMLMRSIWRFRGKRPTVQYMLKRGLVCASA